MVEARREPLAVIGIGCRFPGGADTPGAFWDLLWRGRDAVTDVPPDRWDVAGLHEPGPRAGGKLSSPRGGFLAGIDRFDPLFFGISPREAAVMDPQQRLLLELAWEAVEDAGLVAEALAGSRTGTFLGLSTYDYFLIQHQPSERRPVSPHVMTGTTFSIAANRISHFLDLRGPSLVVDTACSSSLVALHLACRSLREGECDLALVGGASLLLHPSISIAFSNAGMLSPHGQCRSFDADADGYVRSEGAGVIVLAPLSRAVRDGHRVYATVLGSAVNQDGHTPGLTVPSGVAQQAVLREAYRDAGVAPGDVQYVEAHGTGTPVGDPIEAAALGAVLGQGRGAGSPCRLGSVKTNIGHLEAAAGIAGVIKTALALYHGKLPPSLHFRRPNPRIDFDRLRLAVLARPEPWPASAAPARLAGVNSFGFGGTNAHAVLAGAPDAPSPVPPEAVHRAFLVPLSARSPEALAALVGTWADWLTTRPDDDLADIVHSAGARRSHHVHRLAVVADSRAGLREKLQAARDHFSPSRAHAAPRVVFVFTGMGPQWAGMGRELLEREPACREAVAACDRHFLPLAGWSLLAGPEPPLLDEPAFAQPALFALQVGLAALWRSWGITPAAVVGHSVGEVAAAHVAGALTLADACRVVFHRSRLQQRLQGRGKMLAVALTSGEAEALAAADPGRIAIAAVNSPGAVTLSGEGQALADLADRLARRGTFCRFLRVEVPYHSPLLEPLRDEMLRAFQGIEPRTPAVALFSTVTGQRVGGPDLGADYWWDNARRPVAFARAVAGLVEAGHECFLEVGPHPALAASIREGAEASHRPATVLASLRRGEPERAGLLQALGGLYVRGHGVEWRAVGPAGRLVDLPAYPWQRDSYWRETEESRRVRRGEVRSLAPGLLGREEHPLLGRPVRSASPSGTSTRTWHVDLDLQVEHPWLADHAIQGAIVYPAAACFEAALAAARRTGRSALGSVELLAPLVLSPDRLQAVQLVVEDDLGRFTLFARDPGDTWTRVAVGELTRADGPPPALSVEDVRRRCPRELSGEDWYRQLHESGSHYGPAFQGVRAVWCGDGEALALLQAPAAGRGDFACHPALLDSCLQVIQGCLPFSGPGRLDAGTHVPRTARAVRSHAPVTPRPEPLFCHVRRSPEGEGWDVRLHDSAGRGLFEVLGLVAVNIGAAEPTTDELLYEPRWLLQPRGGAFTDGMPPVARLLERIEPPPPASPDPLHDACVAYVRHAFRELGWCPGVLAERVGVAPGQRRLFEAMLATLAGEEEAVDPELAWREALRRFPGRVAELLLLARCGANLPALLRGRVGHAELLCPDGVPMPALEHYAHGAPSSRSVAAVVQSAVRALLRLLPAERPLRILEVGASGLTPFLLPLLPRHRVTYVLADPSEEFLALAGRRYRAFPFVRCLSLESPGEPHRFDVVLSAGRVGLADNHGLWARSLAPGGLLIVAPPWSGDCLSTLVYGAGRSRPEWRESLAASGFTEIACLPEEGRPVFFARAPEAVPASPPMSSSVSLSARESAAPGAGRWLLFSDRGGVAGELADRLRRRGEQVVLVAPGGTCERLADDHFFARPEDVSRLLEELPRGARLRGLVYLAAIDDGPGRHGCTSVLHLVQAFGRAHPHGSPRLYLVTRLAQAVRHGETPDVGQAALWGLGRVIRNEHPELRCTLIDIDPGAALFDELVGDDIEDEIALRGRDRYVCRLLPVRADEVGPSDDAPAPFCLELAPSGLIDSLAPRRAARRAPGPWEVEVEVRAAALNFKDVAKALGLLGAETLRGTWSGSRLGLECSGVVVARGARVEAPNVGDAVIAQAAGCLASHVLADARLVARKPERLSFEEAATVPVAFLTASHALNDLARLRPGERVLVHSASGGVGLAAVQLAALAGAEVFATAGSAEKRDLLRLLGVRHVLDSRSLDFADEVLERTGGAGVDVVLNTLSGPALARGLAVLSPGGRFLELGKRDIEQGARLPLRPFQHHLAFFAIDLDRLWAARPESAHAAFRGVVQRLDAGAIQPLPYRAFPASQARDAFHWMAQARHVGKVVLTMPDAALRVEGDGPEDAVRFRGEGSYLVTGGTRGFGLATAVWLAERGARHLALVGRSAPDDAALRAVRDLEATGVTVLLARADVGLEEDVGRMLREVREALPPLRGVFHAAMVQDEGLLVQIDAERFEAVMGPKFAGAIHLDRLTAADPLDHFVLFSSAVGLFGTVGLGSYAAANTALDALAQRRRARGLPALSVAWPAVSDVGHVAGRPDVRAGFERAGLVPLSSGRLLSVLGVLLRRRAVRTAVLRLDWSRAALHALAAVSPMYSRLAGSTARATATAAPGRPVRELLPTLEGEARRECLLGHLRGLVGQVLGVPPGKIDPHLPLIDMGLESLTAIGLVSRLRDELGLEIPVLKLLGGATLGNLASDFDAAALPDPARKVGG